LSKSSVADLPTHKASRWTRQLRGLYAITPDIVDIAVLVAKVDAAIAGGAQVIQYRNKSASPSLRRKQAAMLSRVCDGGGRSAPQACTWARTTATSPVREPPEAARC
jgi:hypothetical protein